MLFLVQHGTIIYHFFPQITITIFWKKLPENWPQTTYKRRGEPYPQLFNGHFSHFSVMKATLSSKCLFVCQSSKPISLLESYLSPIMPIGYWNHAYHPSYLSPIMTISYHTNQPSCQSTIMPISQSAILPISHHTHQPSCLSTIIITRF